MGQQALLPQQTFCLRIEKGINGYNKEIKQLAQTAYIVYTFLWNTEQLSPKEKEIAINAITVFLQQSNNHSKAFNESVQRVLMASNTFFAIRVLMLK